MRREVIVVALAAHLAQASPATDFAAASDAFRNKNYVDARKTLKDLLIPEEKLSNREDLFNAHAMLGACQIEDHQPEQARAEFEKALQLEPDGNLDPMFFSNVAIQEFDNTKAEMEKKRQEDEDRARKQAEADALKKKLENLRVYEQRNPYLTYVPFGIGQFNNASYVKGGLFLGGELATAGVSLGIWYFLVNRYGLSSSNVKLEDAQTVRTLQGIEIISGGVFFALAAWGIVDARLHYQPQVRVPGSEELLHELEDKKPAKPAKTSLHWGPIIVPNGAGVGLVWETP